MAIQFIQTIVHSLEVEMGAPVLSNQCTRLTDEIEDLITRKVLEVIDSVDLMTCTFTEQMSLNEYETVQDLVRNYKDSSFQRISELFATRIFAYMLNYAGIDSGDLIVSQLVRNDTRYLVMMKLNYKKEFRHFIDDSINIIADKNTYNKKVSEAALINLDTLEVLMIDRNKEKYLRDAFEVQCSLTRKEQEKVLNHVVNELIEENFENTIQAKALAKKNIMESAYNAAEVKVNDVLEETFGEHEQIIEEAKEKMVQFGLKGNIQMTSGRARKYGKSKLKTNTGIEITLPVEILNDTNLVEMVTNPDGTIEVRIKNVGMLVSK